MFAVHDGEDSVTHLAYPSVKRDEGCVETLHGVEVADPYRWLEHSSSPETAEFVATQNSLTEAYLFNTGVDRGEVRRRLEATYHYPKLVRSR